MHPPFLPLTPFSAKFTLRCAFAPALRLRAVPYHAHANTMYTPAQPSPPSCEGLKVFRWPGRG
eukprot:5692407-Prymnesium_polylepis.1